MNSIIRNIKIFITDFLSRSGSSIFIAILLARILSFVSQLLVVRLIDEKDLGLVLYAASFFVFLNPIGGLGLNQGYIRYAAMNPDTAIKNNLLVYSFKKGSFISILLGIVIATISYFVFRNQVQLQYYFLIFSANLFTFYVLELGKNYFRVQHKNQWFSYLEITYNIVLLILTVVFSYYWKAPGYSIALVLSPLLTLLFFLPKIRLTFSDYQKPKDIDKIFWKYGFYAGLAGVASQFLFAIDIILIGSLLNKPELVTHFKYVSLIPFSLLFLPSMFITADFVKITEEIDQKEKIHQYIKSFHTLFLIISLGILGIAFFIPGLVLKMFSIDLHHYILTFRILMIGVVGVLMYRGLFGNLLASIGKSHTNFWISVSALGLNVLLNFYFIPHYGLNGAAITSASIMWFSGLLSYFLFNKYYRELK